MKMQFRRRREKKTDYRGRLALVKSGKTRLVIRRRLNNISVQFIDYHKDGDKTIASAFSNELKKHGWKFSNGNLPAAYLTGLLAGLKAKSHTNKAILDTGLQRSTKGSRIYSALKGVLDSGIFVPHAQEILPDEKRIKGLHIKEEVAKNFEEVKNKIVSEYDKGA
jgi:large subunit ribosomal protein L18